MSDFVEQIKASNEYALIEEHYGDRRAERSGVLYMNHINEGIEIIRRLSYNVPGYSRPYDKTAAARAFCIHPMFQEDHELYCSGTGIALFERSSAWTVLLAMEYRNRANAYLSQHVYDYAKPDAGNLPEVWAMLVADKVQNLKDFRIYHADTHERSGQLFTYFERWLKHLGISHTKFEELIEGL